MWNAERFFLVKLDERLKVLERKVRILERLLETTVFGDNYIFKKVASYIDGLDGGHISHMQPNKRDLEEKSFEVMEATVIPTFFFQAITI